MSGGTSATIRRERTSMTDGEAMFWLIVLFPLIVIVGLWMLLAGDACEFDEA